MENQIYLHNFNFIFFIVLLLTSTKSNTTLFTQRQLFELYAVLYLYNLFDVIMYTCSCEVFLHIRFAGVSYFSSHTIQLQKGRNHLYSEENQNLSIHVCHYRWVFRYLSIKFPFRINKGKSISLIY